jgi:hypothetical protein
MAVYSIAVVVPCRAKLSHEGARFTSAARAGELPLEWKDVLPQPRQKVARPARDGRVLRHMRVEVDQSRKDGDAV